MKLLKLSLITYCLLLNFLPTSVYAQSVSLSLSPPILEIVIKPGKTITSDFTLTNSGDDMVINAQIVPFDQNGLILDSLEKGVSWLEIIEPKMPYVLKQGESAEFVLKINPDLGVKEQDYYQAIVFKNTPEPRLRESQSDIQQTISALILTTVTTAGLAKEAKIERFKLPAIIDSFSSIPLDISVKNTGKSYFHINGQITLTGPLGQIKYPLIPRTHLVGWSKAVLIENPQKNKIAGFFLGKYTLKLGFTLDEGNIKLEQSKTFYAIPYRLISIVTVISIIIYSFRRQFKHKKGLLALLILIPALLLSTPAKISAQSQSNSKINIWAGLDFKSYIKIYGFTSPKSLVRAESIRTLGQTIADEKGYFTIDNIALSRESKEICLQALDGKNRLSFPVCLPLPPGNNKKTIGPLVLPPTLSLSSSAFYTGQKAFAQGQFLPDSKLQIRLFNNLSSSPLPPLEVVADPQGEFNFSLPTKFASQWRVYAAGEFQNNNVPKSQTLYFAIYPKRYILLEKFLTAVLWLLTFLITSFLLYLYDRRTGNLQPLLNELKDTVLYINKRKLSPFATKLNSKRKLIWYNLRESVKRHQK